MTGHAKALPNYLRLLKHYDELEKDKMLVYYEDFVLDPVATLEEVVKFLTNFGWSVLNNRYLADQIEKSAMETQSPQHHLLSISPTVKILFFTLIISLQSRE